MARCRPLSLRLLTLGPAALATGLARLAAQGLTALLGWWWMAGTGAASAGWHGSPALAAVPPLALGAAAVPALSACRLDVQTLQQSR